MKRALVALGALALALTGCANAYPAPHPMTDDERAVWWTGFLDATWTSTGLDDSDRPVVGAPDVIDQDEWGSTVLQCMSDAGLTSVSIGWGADGARIDDPSQRARLGMYRCAAAHSFVPDLSVGASRAQLQYLWRYWAGWTVPCMTAHGYRPEGVPSEKDFLDATNVTWNPYYSLGSTSVNTASSVPDTLRTLCGADFGALGSLW